MSAQTIRDPSFSTLCKCRRCGGALFQDADSCPYCGSDRPLDTVARTRPKAVPGSVGPTAVPPALPTAAGAPAPRISPPVRPTVTAVYQSDYQFEHRLPFRHSRRWSFAKGFLLGGAIFAIACAAYLLLGASPRQASTTDDRSTQSSRGSISLYAQQQTSETPPAAGAGPQSGAPKAHVMPQTRDVPDSLRAARASLAENNLSDAKAASNAALARDEENEDARAIQRDIAAREQRRDSALQSAARCASQHAWACVQEQASDALAIDSSSQEAQSLMERAILATAWAPPSSPPGSPNSPTGAAQAAAAVPLPRGASTVRLPSSQDWGTAAPVTAKDSGASAPPLPPLPPPHERTAKNAPTNANPTSLDSANAVAPVAAADESPAAGVASPTSSDNSADQEQRAIQQFGWTHAKPADTPN
jgi:hypothetical protein